MPYQTLATRTIGLSREYVASNGKGGKRSAQHLSVFAIDGAAAGIYFFNSLMKAVAHASPVTALHLLNIESSAEDQQAQHHYADKTEVHSPQYVTFYFHYSSEFFSCLLWYQSR